MLKKIPTIISPELMYALMRMGHGDEILFADCNFPAVTKAALSPTNTVIRADGIDIDTLLCAVADYFPLDVSYSENVVMMKVPRELEGCTNAHSSYRSILKDGVFLELLKSEFYERSAKCFAIVATGERRRFANVILRKGIVRADE